MPGMDEAFFDDFFENVIWFIYRRDASVLFRINCIVEFVDLIEILKDKKEGLLLKSDKIANVTNEW